MNQRRNCREPRTTDLLLLTPRTFVESLHLSPSHLISVCFLCTSSSASFVLCSSSSFTSSKTVSRYLSDAVLCMLILLSIRNSQTSCLSLKCSTSSLSSKQRLSSTAKPFSCPAHLAILAKTISFSPCLEIAGVFLPFSFHACFAIRIVLTCGSFGDRIRSFSSLALTFVTSLSSNYFNIVLAIPSQASVQILVVSLLYTPSCSFFLHHPLPPAPIPSHSACNQVLAFFLLF